MIVLDSSGWLAIFKGAANAAEFRARVDDADAVLVPAIVVYEVYKVMRRDYPPDDAELATMELQQHSLVDLDPALALAAAAASLEHGLAMADAIVYATAQTHHATLVTGDVDFRELPGVEFIPLDEA